MGKNSKSTRNERNRLAAAGVQKHITAPIVLDGATRQPSEVVSILLDPITKADATTVAEGSYHQAVAAEKASTALANAVYEDLKKTVLIQFKGQTTVLADFGIEEKAPKVPTTATKAEAAAKRKAKAQAKKAAEAAAASPTPATPPATPKT